MRRVAWVLVGFILYPFVMPWALLVIPGLNEGLQFVMARYAELISGVTGIR